MLSWYGRHFITRPEGITLDDVGRPGRAPEQIPRSYLCEMARGVERGKVGKEGGERNGAASGVPSAKRR